MKTMFYFGCVRTPGHFLWEREQSSYYAEQMARKIPGLNPNLLRSLDGVFAPQLNGTETEGLYQESIVPPVRIVAWWDRSVDRRGACNSALIGYGYASSEEMLDDAPRLFPTVMARQPRPKPAFKIDIPTEKAVMPVE